MTVEYGTGLENANSYVDVQYANDYFSTRGYTSWAELEDSAKEVYLIKATDYINNAYKWNGKKLKSEQALRFPRKDLFDYEGEKVEGIPTALKDAVSECAKLVQSGVEMYLTHESAGDITSEKIGELSFSYDVSNALKDSSVYDSINLRLRGLYEDTTKAKIVCGTIKRV